MTIRVGIDATIANTPPLSGVGSHIARLLEGLQQQAPPAMEFRIFYAATDAGAASRARQHLPSSPRMQHIQVPFLRGYGAAHQLHWRVLFPLAVRRARCSIFHGPAHVLPRVRHIPTIVTIHDLAFYEYDLYSPSFTNSLRDEVARSISHATAVIAVSDRTRSDIARLAGRSTNVNIVYNGIQQPDESRATAQPEDAAVLEALGVRRRYVLYVGDFNPRKNVGYLVDSFSRLAHISPPLNVQLVLAGESAAAAQALRARAAHCGLVNDDVVMTGRVSDDLLAVLYRNASAFTLCSLTEGFSMVTVEAMSYAVPVVATDVGAINEVAGMAAELVPLGQPDVVAHALVRALTPGPRREEMRRRGLERARAFTWEAAARRTIAVYESIASARPSRNAGNA